MSTERYYIQDISGNNVIPIPNTTDLTKLKRKLEHIGAQTVVAGATHANAMDGREIFDILSRGNAEFQEKTGRPMTYSEMREIYG